MATQPISKLVTMLNAAGTTFNAIKMNVTDTASAAASNLMDLQVGGSSRFSLRKSGVGLAHSEWQAPSIWATSVLYVGPSAQVGLISNGVGTLEQRGGTSAQTFRVYNTYTDASNYERGVFDWSTAANLLTIGTAKAGTGATRAISVIVGGAQKLQIGAASAIWDVGLTFATDNTYDIGAVGANRPRDIFSARDVYANSNTGGFYWGLSGDLALFRDDANILAQRRSTNAQAFRLYNTYTDASNYERAVAAWSGNIFYFGTQAAGTGTGSREIIFFTNGTNRWSIGGSSGHFLAAADNTYDIGASGANRPRNIYAAGQTDIAGLSGSITATAVPAGGTQALRMTTTSALGVYVGSGAPTVSAAKGSLYLRTDGTTTNDRMYVNTNGSTTWTAVTTAA